MYKDDITWEEVAAVFVAVVSIGVSLMGVVAWSMGVL